MDITVLDLVFVSFITSCVAAGITLTIAAFWFSDAYPAPSWSAPRWKGAAPAWLRALGVLVVAVAVIVWALPAGDSEPGAGSEGSFAPASNATQPTPAGSPERAATASNPAPTPPPLPTATPTPTVGPAGLAMVDPTPTDEGEAERVEQQQPIFFRYQIQQGDTLTGIAQRFGIGTQYILWNNIDILTDANLLPPGQTLQVPSVEGIIHDVRLHETLIEIADLYDADVNDIVAFAANNLPNATTVREGSTILVPGGRVVTQPPPPPPTPSRGARATPAPALTASVAPPSLSSAVASLETPSPTAAPTPTSSSSGTFIEYTVQQGDSLVAIVRRFLPDGASFDEFARRLIDLNDVDDGSRLGVGEVLRIPRD